MNISKLTTKEQQIYQTLRRSMEQYAPLSDNTWQALIDISNIKTLAKNTVIVDLGDVPHSYAYIYKGLVRAFSINSKGQEYTKIFFKEGMFPGAMTALLTSTPSSLAIETIEQTELVEIDFIKYRQLLADKEELKLYQINYLEKNWVIEKEQRELALVQQDAGIRYQEFMQSHPDLLERIPQYYIASHLGITPTQLSRIRKILFDQPM